ncbi:vacuolar amino acid transporter 1-like [Gossypium australe]|uniref:Vacuolar amino acid transporter 1-like n=1 Tax=Gossypium australe TaxID=47621 RepID=A0A5B6V3W2_9ROSI|nr:vacuolar amino acid transporter 1-like [Gossypium australe]
MKIDEDLGLDREDAFQTDDEENRAERVCCHVEDDTESDFTFPSRNSSTNCIEANNSKWPQSYRKSMDMLKGTTPQSLSFLKRSGATGPMGSSSCNNDESSLGTPLIFDTILDEEVHTPILLTSEQSVSVNGSIPSEKQCSFTQALINGINVLSGIGLLTTPYAVKEGGWFSLTLLIIFGIIACYTGVLLKRCLESSPGLQTYPDIGQAAFGVAGRLMISAACVEYVIMMSDNLSMIFPTTNIHFAEIYLDAPQVFAIIGTLFILPTVWLRDLSLLSYISVGGVGASILMVLCLLWVGVDQVGFHRGGTALNLANLPISVGIYSFCYAGHSVFPNIYSSMREPSLFPFVLVGRALLTCVSSFMFCWTVCTGVAISGFLIFGDSVESQFTLNMPMKFLASKIAVCTVVIITVSKYALTLTPIALSLEELVSSTWFRSYGVSILIRTALVISTLVVAMTVPFFAFVMALAGSLLAMLITIIFPCACYLSILGDRLNKLQITACICIAVLGLVIACLGTYSSIIRIAGRLD